MKRGNRGGLLAALAGVTGAGVSTAACTDDGRQETIDSSSHVARENDGPKADKEPRGHDDDRDRGRGGSAGKGGKAGSGGAGGRGGAAGQGGLSGTGGSGGSAGSGGSGGGSSCASPSVPCG
jgi:hypothetical protein